MIRNHAHIVFSGLARARKRHVVCSVAVVALALAACPVAAQTPTPWPTPIVTTEYVIQQVVTYGDGGVIIAGLLVAGLLLLDILLRVAERLTDR